jgi:hypothetical protein
VTTEALVTDRTQGAWHPGDTGPRPSWRYALFGGVLRSQLEFPELLVASTKQCDWTLEVATSAPPSVQLEPLGERQLGAESYRLARTPSGLRLEYSHVGCFDIGNNGSSAIWYRHDDANPELVRAIALGPVLALALEMSGLLCLHASAVVTGGRAIAFVGPKYHGKSTLAAALAAAGAQLVGDDLLAVSPGPPVTVRPGVPSVRLWSDTAETLSVDDRCDRVVRGIKTTAAGFKASPFEGVAPLDAVYVLAPTSAAEAASAVSRVLLPGAAGALALAGQTKLPDSLVGLRAAGAQLAAASAVAEQVPVYSLRTVRDFARLPEVVEQILDWHREVRP